MKKNFNRNHGNLTRKVPRIKTLVNLKIKNQFINLKIIIAMETIIFTVRYPQLNLYIVNITDAVLNFNFNSSAKFLQNKHNIENFIYLSK